MDRLILKLCSERIRHSDLDSRHQALLQNASFFFLGMMHRHQHGQRMAFIRTIRSGQHVGAVLKAYDPQDSKANVDESIEAILELSQTGDLAFSRFVGPYSQFLIVELQLLPFDGQSLEAAHCLDVIITKSANLLLLHPQLIIIPASPIAIPALPSSSPPSPQMKVGGMNGKCKLQK